MEGTCRNIARPVAGFNNDSVKRGMRECYGSGSTLVEAVRTGEAWYRALVKSHQGWSLETALASKVASRRVKPPALWYVRTRLPSSRSLSQSSALQLSCAAGNSSRCSHRCKNPVVDGRSHRETNQTGGGEGSGCRRWGSVAKGSTGNAAVEERPEADMEDDSRMKSRLDRVRLTSRDSD
jgi:hypothetical protein